MDEPGSIGTLIAISTGQLGIFNTWIKDFIILFCLIIINGFFSASELSIVSLNDAKIKKQAEEGDKYAKRLLSLIEKPSEFLATVQVGVTLAGFLSSAFAADKFAGPLAELLDPQHQYPFIQPLSLIFLTIVLSYFSLVFGELVPKRLAMRNPEKLAKRFLKLICFFDALLRPITRFLGFSTNLVLRCFGVNPSEESNKITEEEIRMMIDVGREEGNIHITEKEMIENIFEFNDKEVAEIMTHRTEVTAIEVNTPLEKVLQIILSEKFSRIPVYEENLDNIIGVLHIKDILAVLADKYFLSKNIEIDFDLRSILREAYNTPETKTIDSLFREMQRDGLQMAIVIDEYGGTAGIITIEDLLEEIVGNINDEYDEDVSYINENPDGSYIIDGRCEINELERYFPKLNFLSDDDTYDTIAGLVIHLLNRLPEQGEKVCVSKGNMDFEVLEMADKRIAKIKMIIRSSNEEDADEIDE